MQNHTLREVGTERSFDASCVRNICTKNYQNLTIGFQVTVENVGDVFLRHSVRYCCQSPGKCVRSSPVSSYILYPLLFLLLFSNWPFLFFLFVFPSFPPCFFFASFYPLLDLRSLTRKTKEIRAREGKRKENEKVRKKERRRGGGERKGIISLRCKCDIVIIVVLLEDIKMQKLWSSVYVTICRRKLGLYRIQ